MDKNFTINFLQNLNKIENIKSFKALLQIFFISKPYYNIVEYFNDN